MNNKLALILILGSFAVLFIFQNVSVVEIKFLFWSIQMSRSLLVLLLLVVGIIIGWVMHGHLKYRKDKTNGVD